MQEVTTNYSYVNASGVLAPKIPTSMHSTSTSSLIELRTLFGRFPMTDQQEELGKGLTWLIENLYPCLSHACRV